MSTEKWLWGLSCVLISLMCGCTIFGDTADVGLKDPENNINNANNLNNLNNLNNANNLNSDVSGQCTNPRDDATLTQANFNPHMVSRECLAMCDADTAQETCTHDCMRSDTDLSEGCADCFSVLAVCSRGCPECDADPNSGECRFCQVEAECFVGFTQCTGLGEVSNNTSVNSAPNNMEPNNSIQPGINQCLAPSDAAIINTEAVDQEAIARECGSSCTTDENTGCHTACVRNGTGLSEVCSECYGALIGCSLDFCLSVCVADSESTDCLDCQQSAGCSARFSTCSGLPET